MNYFIGADVSTVSNSLDMSEFPELSAGDGRKNNSTTVTQSAANQLKPNYGYIILILHEVL